MRLSDDLKAMLEEATSVAIVGNAGSLAKGKLGSEIDSHDLVIRMNAGAPRRKLIEHTGERTGLWVVGGLPVYHRTWVKRWPRNAVPPVLFKGRFSTEESPSSLDRCLCPPAGWISKDDHARYNTASGLSRPTTGCTTCQWVAEVMPHASVHIYGMDFFKTRHWFDSGGCARVHHPRREEAFLRNFADSHGYVWT